MSEELVQLDLHGQVAKDAPRNPVFTGMGIDPEVREKIALMVVGGSSFREIRRVTGCSTNTVAAVRNSLPPDEIETLKRRAAGNLLTMATACGEEFLERLDRGDVKTETLPVAMGIALQRLNELQQQPGMVLHLHAQVGTGAGPEAAEEWLARQMTATGMGYPGRNGRSKGAGLNGGSSDSASLVEGLQMLDCVPCDDDSSVISSEAGQKGDQGGGGGERGRGLSPDTFRDGEKF